MNAQWVNMWYRGFLKRKWQHSTSHDQRQIKHLQRTSTHFICPKYFIHALVFIVTHKWNWFRPGFAQPMLVSCLRRHLNSSVKPSAELYHYASSRTAVKVHPIPNRISLLPLPDTSAAEKYRDGAWVASCRWDFHGWHCSPINNESLWKDTIPQPKPSSDNNVSPILETLLSFSNKIFRIERGIE